MATYSTEHPKYGDVDIEYSVSSPEPDVGLPYGVFETIAIWAEVDGEVVDISGQLSQEDIETLELKASEYEFSEPDYPDEYPDDYWDR